MSTRWDIVRSQYQPKLEVLSTELDQVKRLNGLVPELMDADAARELSMVSAGVERQLTKLRNNEFHVAVVGLEKAGKSTFINAWLKAEILPNTDKRCTYTSTEIRSISGAERQLIEIEFFEASKLEEMRAEYKRIASGSGFEAENAEKDLKEIKEHWDTISKHLGRSVEQISFNDSSEVMAELWGYVADPKCARAVRTVKVFTKDLADERGIVFHDVPGYDSPIQMHKEQARYELMRADAVIFVTNISDTVSLRDSQVQILKEVKDQEDPSISISDKVFFFLNKVDKVDTDVDLANRLRSAHEEIVDRYQACKPERVIAGSAAINLVEKGHFVRSETRRTIGDKRPKLMSLKPPFDDGMDHLKGQIGRYLDEDRAEVLERRCRSFLSKGNDTVESALNYATQNFPGSLEDFEQEKASRALEQLNDWYDDKWEAYKLALVEYWQKEVQPVEDINAASISNPRIVELREKYVSLVEGLGFEEHVTEERLKASFAGIRNQYARPAMANAAIREELIDELFMPAMHDLTSDLSGVLNDIVSTAGQWVVEHFFGLEEVKQCAIPGASVEHYRTELHHSLNALLLRYARPAADICIRTSRSTPDRRNMIDAFEREIQLLCLYYEGADSRKKNLLTYLLVGEWLNPLEVLGKEGLEAAAAAHPAARRVRQFAGAPSSIHDPSPIVGGPRNVEAAATQTASRLQARLDELMRAEPADTFSKVQQEIEADTLVFIDYLKNAVYPAASFDRYANQELARLKTHLVSDQMRRRVRKVITRAYSQRDSRVSSHLEGEAERIEMTRRILSVIDQLRTAHTKARRMD